ncbi:MAG TPA: hypothetical protein VGH80_03585 [Xanthomonadaceae bacterium]|jgi:hypothetical protein
MYRILATASLGLLLAGCVTVHATAYQPSIENTQALSSEGNSKIAVDAFNAANGVENRSLSVRGSQLTGGGSDGTFATYVHDALQAELQTAGRYDQASQIRLSGTLTRNDLNGANMSVGTAQVGARFVVTRQNTKVYDKELVADHHWDSSFVGAIAIPAAMQNYTTTLQKLVAQLFADPDFVKASAPAP